MEAYASGFFVFISVLALFLFFCFSLTAQDYYNVKEHYMDCLLMSDYQL